MNDRSFFDTNVLVYVFDSHSPAKQARAREAFAEQARSGRIVLSPQVLQEFFVVVTRKLETPLPGNEAIAALEHLAELPLVPVDGPLILRAARLHQKESISLWDALIVQAALESGCKILFTEDLQNGRRFGDLRVQNPFVE